MKDENIRRYSLDDIRRMNAAGDFVPTGKKAPSYQIDPAFWRNAKVVKPVSKTSVHVRLDSDILEWLKAQGSGHLTHINAILRSYYEAHQA